MQLPQTDVVRTTYLGGARLWARLSCCCALLVACTSPTDGPADLPAEWQDAERIHDLLQRGCGDSALDGVRETLDADGEDGRIAIEYRHAHFRCEQDVEGFLRRAGGRADVLVQPVDMHPQSVAGCDCLYDISMTIPVEPGSYELTLYRRWDNLNEPNDPIEVDSTTVDAQ